MACGAVVLALIFLFAGWFHLQPIFKPTVSWFQSNESRLNHHLAGLFGITSLAWSGHLVHVAIPESRGCCHSRWDNFLSLLPHPSVTTILFWKLGLYILKIRIKPPIFSIQVKVLEQQF